MMALNESTFGIPLETLLEGFAECPSVDDRKVTGLSMDSRNIGHGYLFLACHGANTSGVQYIGKAIKAGAIAVAAEADSQTEAFNGKVPVIAVKNLKEKAGEIASRFYGHPSSKMKVIGVTGTNGKTSVTNFIVQGLTIREKNKTGLIGTLGSGIYPHLDNGINTTPDPVLLQHILADFYQHGIETVAMEVSSHGLDQGRVKGVDFNIGVFTNLSMDHLDYHGNMDSYADAKKRYFIDYGIDNAVINIDDEYGLELSKEIGNSVPVITYGLQQPCDVTARVSESEHGMTLDIRSPWGEGRLQVSITGGYNACNLLAVVAVLNLLGIPFQETLQMLSPLAPVPGRMEKFGGSGRALVYVDYAHTPDALEKVLTLVKNMEPGKLVCVFGCGGDRDRTKRALMGAIAESFADEVILTNDNPRGEDPASIIRDILSGFKSRDAVMIEPDRASAIRAAIKSAGAGDIVLVAGKGHETYQEIAGVRLPFSDQQAVRNLLEGNR